MRFTSLLLHTLTLITLVLCVSSCKKYNKAVVTESVTQRDTALFHKPTLSDLKKTDSSASSSLSTCDKNRLAYHEKKFVDVPLPLSCSKVVGYDDQVTATSTSLTRTTSMSAPQLVEFYACMLEQLGWCLKTSTVCPHERVLVWEKPHKLCVISLRTSPQQSSWLRYFRKAATPQTLLVVHTTTFSS